MAEIHNFRASTRMRLLELCIFALIVYKKIDFLIMALYCKWITVVFSPINANCPVPFVTDLNSN